MEITFRPEDVPLRRDVNTLGRLLGEVLQELGPDGLYDRVEAARQAAIDRRAGKPGAEERFLSLLGGLEPSEGMEIVRAFAAYFDLVNMAERVHRIRRRRDYLKEGNAQPDSFADVLPKLKRAGLSEEELVALLQRLDFTPVFTAHPTQATRRTLLAKQQRIARALVDRLDPEHITPQEDRTALARVRTEIGVAWQTEQHAAQPTVADEVEHVVFFLSDVVYRVVPALYQRLEDAVASSYGEAVAKTIPRALRFASWVGGDMDGNPKVGPETIRATLERHRELILQRYLREVRELFDHMSHSRSRVGVLPVVEATLERYRERMPTTYAQIPSRYHAMPYRMLLWLMSARLEAANPTSRTQNLEHPYQHPNELLTDLRILERSLNERSGPRTGQYRVQRLIRRVETFGFHLAALDVRQHAWVHRRAVGELLQREDFPELSPEERLATLEQALAAPTPDVTPKEGGALQRCLAVMQTIGAAQRRHGEGAVGLYIISMAEGADDALAVLYLAQAAGLTGHDGSIHLDVAPLFETVPDLRSSGRTLAALLEHPRYAEHLRRRGNEQMVMLGYSDSNKESGLAASRWALHNAQIAMLRVAEEHGVSLQLFHGRGGTISRGGGKPREGVLAEPRGAVQGRLRITEQGEIIAMKYGLRDIALRTMELMLGAILEHSVQAPKRPPEPEAWITAAQLIAERSRQAYRALVVEDKNFLAYFRAATPIDVIERLRIGSRPAARPATGNQLGGGVETLRAIPWVFAWTQSRHLLPGWYGLGTGLEAAIETLGFDVLAEMHASWPFFANLISDAEMVLAKSDMPIAKHYASLANDSGHAIGDLVYPKILAEYEKTVKLVCRLRGSAGLLDKEPVLQRAIRLRNPYVDPMSLLQVDYLRRWRATQRTDPELELALLATVRGIAQGMQNTG